jgi:hypothetical protein
MTEQTKTVTWETLLGNVAPAENYTARRVTRGERLYTPQPATTTMPPAPADLDLQLLKECKLPNGLQMEFKLLIPGAPPESFYVTKTKGGVSSHWAMYALYADPLYGDLGTLEMPKDARKWLGKSPWATMMMVAHEVPAWCQSTYPNPATLHFSHLVSDATALIHLSRPSVVSIIDPILYGAVVCGRWWGFVPLAEWTI